MFLWKSKYEKHLDELLSNLKLNMSNNYKDAAQEDFLKYEEAFEQYKDEGRLKGKALEYYSSQLGSYRVRLMGFTHKDQKPYWASK